MNYEVKKLEKSAVEVKLHLTSEEVKPIVDKVLAHVGEHAEVAGFRKDMHLRKHLWLTIKTI